MRFVGRFRRLQLPAACMEKRNGSASFAGASARDVVPRDITGLARASCTAFLAQRPLRRPNTPGGRHGRTIKTMERIHSYGQSPITGEHVPASMQTPYDSTVNAGKSSARASASVRLASCNLNCERGGEWTVGANHHLILIESFAQRAQAGLCGHRVKLFHCKKRRILSHSRPAYHAYIQSLVPASTAALSGL